jgi:hypothetical protein
MRATYPLYALTAALAFSSLLLAKQPPAAASALTEPQVRALLAEKGYTRIDDLDFEDGFWETDVTSADGNRVDVRVDPKSERVYAEKRVSSLSENDIKAKLSAAGYSKVHDVDFDDGIWKAEAEREDGKDVEVHLDAQDGHVLGVQND